MGTLDSFVTEVEQTIASGDPERRSRSLRQLTQLFLAQASKLNDAHVLVFDEVIIRLARSVGSEARGELSACLADVGNAPIKSVRNLALDSDVVVAEPILERSTRLTDDDLLAVAGGQAQGHLLAVSRRSALSEKVTDALVNRGDQQVVRAVAQNKGAKISERALSSLVEKAQGDGDLRDLLQKRPDVPGDRLQVAPSPPKPQKERAAKPNPVAAAQVRRMEEALAKLATAMVTASEPSRDISSALERLARTAKGKAIEEVRAANWMRADKIDDALAAIAHNAGLPGTTIVRAYDTPEYEPLLLVVRAARYSWNTFKLLLTARDGKGPSPEVLKTSFETFQQLSQANAQQLGRLIGMRDAGTSATAAA
jgi:uncharacterized protein (DUF2336 family)